jgi:hypothetical protein
LLATAPAGQLGDRYPGHQVGIIGRPALTSPDRLAIIIGRTPDEVAAIAMAEKVTASGPRRPRCGPWR